MIRCLILLPIKIPKFTACIVMVYFCVMDFSYPIKSLMRMDKKSDDKLKRIESLESACSNSGDVMILMPAYKFNDCSARLFYIAHTVLQ